MKHTCKAIVITVSEYEIEMRSLRHKPEADDGDGEGELVSTNIINHQYDSYSLTNRQLLTDKSTISNDSYRYSLTNLYSGSETCSHN